MTQDVTNTRVKSNAKRLRLFCSRELRFHKKYQKVRNFGICSGVDGQPSYNARPSQDLVVNMDFSDDKVRAKVHR
jgi:hypothetical protein